MVLEESVARVVFWKHHVCFQMLHFGMAGCAEQWFPNADLGMVARLATSESPGLFISYMFFSSKHRDSDSLSLEWNLGIYVSISDYEASLENIVY